MTNKFQKNPVKLFNSYAAAYNEHTVNFPDSDTLGGAAVLNDNNGNFTMQVKEPVYDFQMIKDPIISELQIVPIRYGGGVVTGLVGNGSINTNMNPADSSPPNINDEPSTSQKDTAEKTEKRNRNIAIVLILVLLVAIVFLMRKK